MIFRALALVLCSVLLLACGDKDEVLEPADLPDIRPEVRLKRIWSADAGAEDETVGARLVPALAIDTVYAIDARGRVFARDRANGRLRWKTKTVFEFSAGPTAAYGQLFAGTRKGEVVALSAEDGRTLWTARLAGEVLAPPVVDGGDVVVRTTAGEVAVLDRIGGTLRWNHDHGAPTLTLRALSRPLVLPDIVIAGTAAGELVAIDRATGRQVWERRSAEPEGKSELERLVDVAGDFLIVGDRIHAVTFQGRIVAMELDSGQFTWQQNLSSFQPLAHADGIIFAVDADSRISAWRAADGVMLWQQNGLLARGLTGCAIFGSHLLVGDFEGYVHVLRQVDGAFVGRRRVDRDGIAATPVIDDSTAYVFGRSGKIAALRLK